MLTGTRTKLATHHQDLVQVESTAATKLRDLGIVLRQLFPRVLEDLVWNKLVMTVRLEPHSLYAYVDIGLLGIFSHRSHKCPRHCPRRAPAMDVSAEV